ncbi:MAG: S41 family peptidase [Candidatus Aphodosoma sp.]
MDRYIGIIIVLLTSVAAFGQRTKTEPDAVKLAQLLFYIDNFYVDTVDTHVLAEKAVIHMLKELDPHSSYISEKDVARANEHIQGNFEGIGISYQMLNDTVVVNQTIAGCPAEKAGILPGDRLLKVDTATIAGVKKSIGEIPVLIRGPKGSKVEITALRPGESEPMTFRIVRDKIPIHSVDAAYFVDEGIGYIKTNSFSATTSAEIGEALSKLRKQGGLQSLVIDLQGNGGGVMSAAIDMVNRFLDPGRLIVYTQGEHQRREEARSNASGSKLTTIPLVVLTDEYSASASEIVAGALQDWDRAIVIGRRTFGKGLVQRPFRMTDGSEVRLTIARYYTPSGRNIQKPYAEGADSYYRDIEERYRHGEMVHPDSVHFPDSLKYKTMLEGRTVYGGGGIFPDIFIPLDTARYPRYYRQIVAKGIFNRTISDYVDHNRKSLNRQYPTFGKFDSQFSIPDDIVTDIHAKAVADSVKYADESHGSERILKRQAKALVAQSLFGTEYYYRVMNSENDALKQAIIELRKRKQ